MRFVTVSIVTIVLTFCVWQLRSSRNCYDAKICMHSGIERCGEDKDGRLRMFLDLCDIHEFNCAQNTTFRVTPRKRCNILEKPTFKEEADKEKPGSEIHKNNNVDPNTKKPGSKTDNVNDDYDDTNNNEPGLKDEESDNLVDNDDK